MSSVRLKDIGKGQVFRLGCGCVLLYLRVENDKAMLKEIHCCADAFSSETGGYVSSFKMKTVFDDAVLLTDSEAMEYLL